MQECEFMLSNFVRFSELLSVHFPFSVSWITEYEDKRMVQQKQLASYL